MQIRIGGNEVVASAHFLAEVNEDIFLSFLLNGKDVNFRLVFGLDETDSGKDEYVLRSEPDPENEDQGLLTLINWNGPRQIAGPIKIFKSGNDQFFCSISACMANDAYDVFVQVTKGVVHE